MNQKVKYRGGEVPVRDWIPRRRGDIYCSPACGGNCTYADYLKATKAADRLCKRLKGVGWKPRVHENLGWHYNVYNGHLQVYPYSHNTFHCMIGRGTGPDDVGSPSHWNSATPFTSKDPNEAVSAAIHILREVVRETWAVLRAVEAASKDPV